MLSGKIIKSHTHKYTLTDRRAMCCLREGCQHAVAISVTAIQILSVSVRANIYQQCFTITSHYIKSHYVSSDRGLSSTLPQSVTDSPSVVDSFLPIIHPYHFLCHRHPSLISAYILYICPPLYSTIYLFLPPSHSFDSFAHTYLVTRTRGGAETRVIDGLLSRRNDSPLV